MAKLQSVFVPDKERELIEQWVQTHKPRRRIIGRDTLAPVGEAPSHDNIVVEFTELRLSNYHTYQVPLSKILDEVQ